MAIYVIAVVEAIERIFSRHEPDCLSLSEIERYSLAYDICMRMNGAEP